KFNIKNDYFFDIQGIESALINMVEDNPGNRIAYEYLMASYLINKDLRNFIRYFPLIENFNYSEVPVSYQEAMIYIIFLNKKNPIPNAHRYVNDTIKKRLNTYISIYSTYPDAMTRL